MSLRSLFSCHYKIALPNENNEGSGGALERAKRAQRSTMDRKICLSNGWFPLLRNFNVYILRA